MWRSKRYGWPWADGWLKWPAYHVARMREAALCEAAISGYDSAKDKDSWAKANPELNKLFYKLFSLRRNR